MKEPKKDWRELAELVYEYNTRWQEQEEGDDDDSSDEYYD